MKMRNFTRLMVMAGIALVFAGLGFADTLELKDGRVLQGKYLGGTQAVLRFEVNGDVSVEVEVAAILPENLDAYWLFDLTKWL